MDTSIIFSSESKIDLNFLFKSTTLLVNRELPKKEGFPRKFQLSKTWFIRENDQGHFIICSKNLLFNKKKSNVFKSNKTIPLCSINQAKIF